MPKYSIKHKDTTVGGTRPEILEACMVAKDVFFEAGFDCEISGGTERMHGEHSHHYKGLARDVSTLKHGIDKETADRLGAEIRDRLGPEYQVVVERTHIHMEYDPK